MDDWWTVYRVSGEALNDLAARGLENG